MVVELGYSVVNKYVVELLALKMATFGFEWVIKPEVDSLRTPCEATSKFSKLIPL